MLANNIIPINEKREKNCEKYDIFDLTKYILSFFIVAIHTGLFPQILYPWLRVAVPLFFVISSFLLFLKIKKNPKDEPMIIKKFVIRQLKMYLFWFIILLPVTILVRKDWFSEGIAIGIYNSIKNTLFSSSFIASWYISASIWAVLILWKLSSKIDSKKITILCTVLYILCCIRSSYYIRISHFYIIEKTIYWLEKIFVNPIFSFPVALFWINLGKLFADGKIKFRNKEYYALTVISAILLYFEWKLAIKYEGGYSFDCYFLLFPLVVGIFEFLLKHNISLKNAYTLRKISVITYPIHASIARVLMVLLNKISNNTNLVSITCFIIVIITCHLAYFTISKLSGYKKLKFLKNAY